MLNLLRAVNRARKAAGYELLPKEVLPLRRRVVKPFAGDVPPVSGHAAAKLEEPGEELSAAVK
jgi:hypothetical protein